MLTERQREILAFVQGYQSEQGVAPSTREIAKAFRLSQATSLKHLQALAKKGQVQKMADGKWGLEAKELRRRLFSSPVYGTIPAGLPAMREQVPDEMIAIDPGVFRVTKADPEHFWFLRVTGDSMSGANILDGDLVALVRREARPGDIIAALVDENTTFLKRFIIERDRVILRAANPSYPDFSPTQLECQGVVVGVIRRQIA